MYKIEINNEEIYNRHKKYFRECLIANVKDENKQIVFEDQDVSNVNTEFKKQYNKKCVQRQHNKFIKYCIYNYKKISIGNMRQLEEIYEEIKCKFPLIQELIDHKYKFSAYNKNYKDMIYSNALINIFGYNDFSNNDGENFYEVVLKIAKNKKNIVRINKSNYVSLQEEIRNILCKLFPRLKNEIKYFWEDKGKSKLADDLKNNFYELEKEYCLGLTINNYDNEIFKEIWNSYMFVFSLGIRTCPYCNRQYVTPILTSRGKSRGNLDHFLLKNAYPYFSMSIHNLVPVCNSCNSSLKGKKEFDFKSLNPYEDSLDNYIYFNVEISKNDTYVHISKKSDNEEKGIDEVLDTYKLELQYNYHQNQIRELIIKRLSYSQSYIQDLTTNEQLSDLSEDEIIENLVGYSKSSKNINNEPLSKFRRDIVEQLDFFKDKNDQELIENLRKVL